MLIQNIITAILSSLLITLGIGILLATILIIKPTNFISIVILVGLSTVIIMIGLLPVLGKQNGKNINNQ